MKNVMSAIPRIIGVVVIIIVIIFAFKGCIIVIVNENPAKKGKKIHHFWIKKLLTFFKIFFLFSHSITFTLN